MAPDAHVVVRVTRRVAVVAQRAHHGRQLGVVGDHGARVAERAEVLRRVEAERRRAPRASRCAGRRCSAPCACAASSSTGTPSQAAQDRRPSARAARTGARARPPPCPGRPRLRAGSGSMQRVAGSMSTSTGFAPVAAIASSVAMNVLGTVTTSRPGPAPSASEGEPQRLGAVAEPDAVLGAAVVGERRLELVQIRGERERSAARDPVEGRGELRLERLVGAPQVDERDRAHAAPEMAAPGVLTRIFRSVRRLLERAYSASRSSISVKPSVVAARHLPQAGHPGLHGESLVVRVLVVLELVLERRPRPDERHVPEEHVHELRQLVQARLAQEPADRGDARIGGQLLQALVVGLARGQLRDVLHVHVRRGVELHRPEFQHPELAQPAPQANLAE